MSSGESDGDDDNVVPVAAAVASKKRTPRVIHDSSSDDDDDKVVADSGKGTLSRSRNRGNQKPSTPQGSTAKTRASGSAKKENKPSTPASKKGKQEQLPSTTTRGQKTKKASTPESLGVTEPEGEVEESSPVAVGRPGRKRKASPSKKSTTASTLEPPGQSKKRAMQTRSKKP